MCFCRLMNHQALLQPSGNLGLFDIFSCCGPWPIIGVQVEIEQITQILPKWYKGKIIRIFHQHQSLFSKHVIICKVFKSSFWLLSISDDQQWPISTTTVGTKKKYLQIFTIVMLRKNVCIFQLDRLSYFYKQQHWYTIANPNSRFFSIYKI